MILLRSLALALAACAAFFATPARADFEFSDIACETTATTGTGTVNLAGAVTNYLGFLAAGIDTGDTVPYHIVSGDGKLETGIGTVTDGTPDTMSRTADWSTDGAGAELTLSGTSTICIGPITSVWSNADKGDITTSNGFATWTIDGDSVALTTDTTGNYVGSVADGTGIDGTAAGEGATYTPSIDFTEITAGTGLTASGATTLDCDGFSETAVGCLELATTAEAEAGTDTQRAVTAAGLLAAESGKQMIWIPAAAMMGRVTTGADCSIMYDSGTNDVTIRVCSFADGTNFNAHFQVQMPKSWNESTVTFAPVWTATASTGTAEFELACAAISNDDTLNSAMGSAIAVSDTLTTTNDLHDGGESAAVTCANTPAENDYVAFNVMRDTTNDTLGAAALLIGIRLFITTNAFTDD